MPDRNSLSAACWVTTAVLGCFLCVLQLAVMLDLMAGRHGFRALAPLSLASALIFGYWLAGRENLTGRLRWAPSACALLVIFISVALSAFFYDLSWDGEWYQQTAVINIARDWNPIFDPMHEFAKHLQLWVRHYSKGPWYIAAAVYQTTGHIEWGKFIPWTALAAAFFATFAACLDLDLSPRAATAVASLLALNPVTTSELPTYLVDGIMFCFLAVCVAAIVSTLYKPRLSTAFAGVTAAIVAINAKFTGLVFLCFLLAAFGLWILFRQRAQSLRYIAIATGTLVLGTCIWGYNPYVTNTIYRHQPFYPVLGSASYPSLAQQGRDGIDRYETPKNIMGRNRFIRFGYAIFGRPGNQPYRIGRNASLMWPFAARPSDLYCYTYHETRVAGFGPWFSGCFLLAIPLAVWYMLRDPSATSALLLAASTITASLILSPQLWWPRYGPQLWLLPLVPLFFVLRKPCSRRQLQFAWGVVFVLLVNALIVATIRMRWEIGHTIALRHQLQQLHDSGKEYTVSTRYFSDSAEVRLTEAGVRYQNIGMKKIAHAEELISVVEGYPDPIRFVPFGDPPPQPPANPGTHTGRLN